MMTGLLMWLNVSVAKLNTTLQLLVIYWLHRENKILFGRFKHDPVLLQRNDVVFYFLTPQRRRFHGLLEREVWHSLSITWRAKNPREREREREREALKIIMEIAVNTLFSALNPKVSLSISSKFSLHSNGIITYFTNWSFGYR